jgi:uncharacterized protein
MAPLTRAPPEEARDVSVVTLHAELDGKTVRLHQIHEARLACRQGCSSCCVDELTVFEVEAAPIRLRYANLLATGIPHEKGGCAFLDEEGGCRIYEERPYVCRTQGLPLRWLEELGGEIVEQRDICPLNEAGVPLEDLAAADCFTLGPFEERLARLQLAADVLVPRPERECESRTSLRGMFLAR